MRHSFSALMMVIIWVSACALVNANDAAPEPLSKLDPQEAIDACRVLDDAEQRLVCYDSIQGVSVTGGVFGEQSDSVENVSEDSIASVAVIELDEEPEIEDIPINRSRMMRRWELDDATHGGLLHVRAHNPVYALPVRYSSNPNDFPSSPAPGRTVTESLNLDSIEAKFQLSLKTKILDNLTGNNGDLWFGYTQQSSWQVYNSIESSPFRETQYQPEVFASWRTGVNLLGWRWQMFNLGFMHQSNGRNLPLSRSWNRIYAQFGFERGDWQLFIRPWSAFDTEDQPDIQDYYGRGDVRLLWSHRNHDVGITGRLSADDNRGAIQVDWHYPLFGDLKAYLQVFHGYGETLIDYNQKQTTVGLGVSLVQ